MSGDLLPSEDIKNRYLMSSNEPCSPVYTRLNRLRMTLDEQSGIQTPISLKDAMSSQ